MCCRWGLSGRGAPPKCVEAAQRRSLAPQAAGAVSSGTTRAALLATLRHVGQHVAVELPRQLRRPRLEHVHVATLHGKQHLPVGRRRSELAVCAGVRVEVEHRLGEAVRVCMHMGMGMGMCITAALAFGEGGRHGTGCAGGGNGCRGGKQLALVKGSSMSMCAPICSTSPASERVCTSGASPPLHLRVGGRRVGSFGQASRPHLCEEP